MLQQGLWENVKKSCNNETTVAWIWKLTVWNSWCILDSMKISVWSGEPAKWFERRLCSLGKSLIFFSFLWCVCSGIKATRKRWTILMLNLRDTESISSIKSEYGGFLCFFFLFFCNWILFLKSNPCIENRFYVVVFWSSDLFLTLALFLSVNMDFVAQSLASGTVDNWEKQILSSLYYYYCTFGKWKQYSGKF